MRPQRAATGAVDGHHVAVVGGAVEGAAVEQDRAVGIVQTVDLGAALAAGQALLPQLAAVVLAQGDQQAVVAAEEHHAVGDQQAAVAAHAQQRNVALIVHPLAFAGGRIKGINPTVAAAHDDLVADDHRRGQHLGIEFGFPARAAVLCVDAVDVAVQRAHREQVAAYRRTAGILGVLALLVAPAEPAVRARTLRPQRLAGRRVEGGQLAVGAVGVEHAIDHGRTQPHATVARAVAHSFAPQSRHLHRRLEILGQRRRRLHVLLLEGVAAGERQQRNQRNQHGAFDHVNFHAPCFPATARSSSFICKAPRCGASSLIADMAAW